MTARRCPQRPHLLDGYPIGQYHCPSCGCMVLAGAEHSAHEDGCWLPTMSQEEYELELARADAGYALLIDPNTEPDRQLPRLTQAQVWVWMTGPVEPHWAIRGTGVRFRPWLRPDPTGWGECTGP